MLFEWKIIKLIIVFETNTHTQTHIHTHTHTHKEDSVYISSGYSPMNNDNAPADGSLTYLIITSWLRLSDVNWIISIDVSELYTYTNDFNNY